MTGILFADSLLMILVSKPTPERQGMTTSVNTKSKWLFGSSNISQACIPLETDETAIPIRQHGVKTPILQCLSRLLLTKLQFQPTRNASTLVFAERDALKANPQHVDAGMGIRRKIADKAPFHVQPC